MPRCDEITIRELARMQSGLFNYNTSDAFGQAFEADPRQSFTPRQLLDLAFKEPMESPPGKGFHYSNTNTILLGLVVEKLSGQPLSDYVRDHIIAPLGMSHNTFGTSGAYPEPHAQGYTDLSADGATVVATDWNPSSAWAAGAVISSLEHVHTWAPAPSRRGSCCHPRCRQCGCRRFRRPQPSR